MKIFSKQQIYEGDALTAKKQNISSTDLMERAATQIFNWMHLRMQGAPVPIHVFCGIGNNGGDGLVLARHLITYGYNVKTYVVNYSDKRSQDFLINYDRIKEVTKDWPILLTDAEAFPHIGKDDIIVDAIFGIGLNRAVVAWVVKLFMHLRESQAFTLSIDIPSGLFPDKAIKKEDHVVWSHYTLSFQTPKLVFFLPNTAKFIGQWEIIDIGIDPEYIYNTTTTYELIGKQEILPIYKPREKFATKRDYGHCYIIGGTYGKIGAVVLTSKAALTAGAGIVTAYVPNCGYNILQTAIPEVMVATDANEKILTKVTNSPTATVVAFGIGSGTNVKTIAAFEIFLKENKTPLVIDADGINILALKKELVALLPINTILTPHNKELERLIGTWKDDFDMLKKAHLFSKKNKLILVLKGANTKIIYGDKGYINTTGNPGLATAGTGDVLTGIITGLIAQKYTPLQAAIFGVYLHGKAADLSIESTGYQALLASNVIANIGAAYIDLFKPPETNSEEENLDEEE